jgi:hypothetical protein
MSTTPLRLVRLAPEPLGLYIRAGRNDQKDLQTYITAGAGGITGLVFEAKRVGPQKELLALVSDQGLDAVLDPQTQALGTEGGHSEALGKLPWAVADRPHGLEDFGNDIVRRARADKIAEFALRYGFTQILAPTHLLRGSDDPWLGADIETTKALRAALNARGGDKVLINYSLAMDYETFRTTDQRRAILSRLHRLPIDSVWLHINGCGSGSSPTAVRKYGDAAVDFHSLGVPIVADHLGGLVGLSLLAFGVVGGLSHGVTQGERFDCGHWLKKPTGKPFAQGVRVYLSGLDLMLSRVDAEKFFESGGRARSHFGCRNTACCARGVADMLQAPGRHFIYQRTREVAGLSQIPESLRPQRFLEEHLRPASDRALVATQLTLPDELLKKARTQSKRLNDLRVALGKYAQDRRDVTFAQHPSTRRAREARR